MLVLGLFQDGDSVQRNPPGVREGGGDSVFDLRVGDCLPRFEAGEEIVTADVVSCDQPHRVEVIAAFSMAEGKWPGENAVVRAAKRGCVPTVEAAFSGKRSVATSFLHPTAKSWGLRGDRKIQCLAVFPKLRRGPG